MANYSKKFLSKDLSRSILIVITLVLIPPLLINLFLTFYKESAEKYLKYHLGQEVSLKNIYYLPPNSIILNNFFVVMDGPTESNQQISAKKIKLVFSIEKLFSERKVVLTKATFNRPELDYIEYIFSPEEIIAQIKRLIRSLDKSETYSILLKDALFALPPHAGASGYIVIDAVLDLQPTKFVSCKGSLGLARSAKDDFFNKDLDYEFLASFKKGGMNIEKLEFLKGNSSLNLWGTSSGDSLRISGNLLSIEPAEKGIRKKLLLRIPKKLKEKVQEFFPRFGEVLPEFIRPKNTGLNIFDLGCLIKFTPQELQIKNLNFSINDMPLLLKGNIPIFKPGELNIEFSSFPSQTDSRRAEDPRCFFFTIEGALENATFNGKTSFEFLRQRQDNLSSEKIEADFNNLGFVIASYQRLKAVFDRANFSYLIDGHLSEISLVDFSCLLNRDQEKIKFNSRIFDGDLKGEVKIDLNRFPFHSSLKFTINDVGVNQLSSVSDYLSKVYGVLSAEVNYENYPAAALSGRMSITEGYLDNLKFFTWLADFFGISKLKEVGFNELSANFLIDNEISALENIMMDSPEVDLQGYFNIYKDSLVSGKLSLVLSQELLESSPKFKKLLRLIGKDLSGVGFDFQMSGLYENMNFKWLESDFKNKLQDLLPAGMERRLEREIEQAIDSIADEK